jgi:hypothetical protein
MTIPFYTEEIHEPLKQMLYNADNNGEWQAIIDYCEPLIENTNDDNVILCYTFAIMEQALAIHIDDVAETGKYCLELLKRLNHTFGGTDHLKRMIKKQIGLSKSITKKYNKLMDKPLANLSTKEKEKLAYNLAEKGGVENYRICAQLHLELMELNKDNHDESYHYGNYIICLYKSNQLEVANEKLAVFLTWMTHTEKQSYAFLVGNCFQEKILHYTNDAIQFEIIWYEAINNETIKINDSFPVAYAVQDKLLVASDKLGLVQIKKYLVNLINTGRKPREISNEIKIIIANV